MFGTVHDLNAHNSTERFVADGIVRIPNFLPAEVAASLHAELAAREDWRQIFNSGESLFELDRPTQASLTSDKKVELDNAIFAGARSGFQYRFETIRVPDEAEQRRKSPDRLYALADWLSTGQTLEWFRKLSAIPDITFCDAQATAYSPGDFLTGHDDAFEGKNRLAAYVLSLTPVWRLEWGGLLILHGQGDTGSRAFSPEMNVLTVFRVPQMHSVSEVSRASPFRRYSITGWLRSR